MQWMNAFLFLLLTAGHTELQVTIVNRVHALRVPCGILRRIRHIHDLMVPLFPLALIGFLGVTGPRLLIDGEWSDVGSGWLIGLLPCAVGCVCLIVTTMARRLKRPLKHRLQHKSQVFDVEKELGTRPIGDGPYQKLTTFPGNQVCELDFVERTYELPRLPKEMDGLTIMHLTDWHFIGTIDLPYYEFATKLAVETNADMVVFTGDLLDQQKLIEWLPSTLGKLKAPLGCYFILGNHDWYLKPDETRKRLEELGWKDVCGRVETIEVNGQSMAIGGDEQPWMGSRPDFSNVADDAFRLLLSHSPDNIKRARQDNVDLVLAGHNHGGQVRLPIIEAVYSPSVYGCKYASGEFFEEPTLMYVSRGIGGRHPLRIRCRPEITKLTLKSPN